MLDCQFCLTLGLTGGPGCGALERVTRKGTMTKRGKKEDANCGTSCALIFILGLLLEMSLNLFAIF